jgi:hypothetical protein
VFGRLPQDARRDSPTPKDIENACLNLREFVVGRTEQMDSFLVLVALENGNIIAISLSISLSFAYWCGYLHVIYAEKVCCCCFYL